MSSNRKSAPNARWRAFGALFRLLDMMRCWHFGSGLDDSSFQSSRHGGRPRGGEELTLERHTPWHMRNLL